MARRKPQNPYPVSNLTEANEALAGMAECKRAMSAIEDRMNAAIDKAKADAAAEAAPLKKRLADMETGLLIFAEANKGELFAKKRSVEFSHGSIGYRKSTAVKPKSKHTWAMVLKKIKELGLGAIRVKEDVDRDALRSWPAERLELVGARLDVKDVFWAEPAEEDLESKAA